MQDKKLFSRILSKRGAGSRHRLAAPILFLPLSLLSTLWRGKPPGMCGTITFAASLVVRALQHEPRAKNPGGSPSHVFRDPLPASPALISATHMPRNLLSALSPPTLAPSTRARHYVPAPALMNQNFAFGSRMHVCTATTSTSISLSAPRRACLRAPRFREIRSRLSLLLLDSTLEAPASRVRLSIFFVPFRAIIARVKFIFLS